MWRLIRRVGFALGTSGVLATFFRMRGEGDVAPLASGWRAVSADEFRA